MYIGFNVELMLLTSSVFIYKAIFYFSNSPSGLCAYTTPINSTATRTFIVSSVHVCRSSAYR